MIRKISTIIAVGVLFTGCAATSPSNTPYDHNEFFSVPQRELTRTVTWRVLPDNIVSEVCQKNTHGRFAGQKILGCARWYGNQCTIITGANTDTAILGHEVRHCYDGDFHD
mgnify:CR=1 FL=1